MRKYIGVPVRVRIVGFFDIVVRQSQQRFPVGHHFR